MGLGRGIRQKLGLYGRRMKVDYTADSLGVRNKNLAPLNEPKFLKAWEHAKIGNQEGWKGKTPDVRWRAHTALWAAKQGLSLKGDFVECGVFLGLLSLTICHYLDFGKVPKSFWLFDTFKGLPLENLDQGDRDVAQQINKQYFDCYDLAKRNFAPFENAKLIKGRLPESLEKANIDRIAYLSMDLNNVAAEKAVIEELWGRLSSSAIVVIDDYGWKAFADQHEMWNAFAASKARSILLMPTGQGVLIKD